MSRVASPLSLVAGGVSASLGEQETAPAGIARVSGEQLAESRIFSCEQARRFVRATCGCRLAQRRGNAAGDEG